MVSMRKHPPSVIQITALDVGGAWKVVERLSKKIHEAGCETEILVLSPKGKLVSKKIYNLFSKIDLKISTQSKSVLSFSLFRGVGILTLLKMYRRKIGSAEIVHLHWLPGLFEQRDKFFNRSTVIWTIHDFEAFSGGCHQSYGCVKFQNKCDSCPQTLALFHNKVEKSLKVKALNTDRLRNLTIVVPSHWLASQVESSLIMGSRQIHVIGNPIPTEVFNSCGSLRDFKNNKVTVGVLGSNYPQGKGALASLEILAKFKEEFKGDTEIITFGSAHKDVPGHSVPEGSSDSEIAVNLKNCDFFLFFSNGETFGNFVAEAAACGVIVISNGVGPIVELIENEKTGLIVSHKSESDLGRWMSLAYLESRRAEMSGKAEDFIRKNFDSKIIAKKYIELYESSRQ